MRLRDVRERVPVEEVPAQRPARVQLLERLARRGVGERGRERAEAELLEPRGRDGRALGRRRRRGRISLG